MQHMSNQLQNFEAADIGKILAIINNRSMIAYNQLMATASNAFEDVNKVPEIIDALLSENWVILHDNALRVSELGSQWLSEEGSSLTVESEDSDELDSPVKPYDVAKLKMESRTMSVFQTLRMIEKHKSGEVGGIKLNPDFQRAFVWDEHKQSRLIESVLIRIPLPAFYIDASNQVEWNVVDGLQRLTTLYRYCRDEAFALTGLQFLVELSGKKFSDLPPQYRVLIEDDTQLQFYNLMPGTPSSAKYTIFSRVNTGGLQLTPQEIRHALNQGKITVALAELAHHRIFLSATDGVVESLRMSDREIILRALSFMHFGVESYRRYNELDEFLLAAMEELNKVSDAQLEKLKFDFLESVAKVRLIFGRYAFRKFYQVNGRRSPFNKALFEAWTYCVRDYTQDTLVKNRSKIIDLFIKKISLPWDSLTRSISSGTGGYFSVATRFAEIEGILKVAAND